jgi:hypothetical protein
VRLNPGDRLPEPDPSANPLVIRNQPLYRVTRLVQQTQWSALYEGKKVFRNFAFNKGTVEEAPGEECLDVFLKTLAYPLLDNRAYVKARRDHAWFEAKKVFGNRKTNLLPEPLDYLEIPNDQDAFAFPHSKQLASKEPVLVLEKVHGRPLARWRKEGSPSLPRILRVLAEVLDFLAGMHGQKLLLNGLSHLALWIDDMDRVHYLASDMVLDLKRQTDRHLLCPPERYIQGFCAPEALTMTTELGFDSDLFGWAALAYFLITGDNPVNIAQTQGQRYCSFQKAHFACLRKELKALQWRNICRAQDLFKIPGHRFAQTWPDSFVRALEDCLAASPSGRPRSHEELRRLWQAPRPRPVPVALAVRAGLLVEVLWSGRGLEPDLDILIRRGAGTVPANPEQGQPVVGRPFQSRITDSPPIAPSGKLTSLPPTYYSLFTRLQLDGGDLCSDAAPARPLDLAEPAELRAFAEQLAGPHADPSSLLQLDNIPDELQLLAELPNVFPLVEAWLSSPRALVRRWAIWLLERRLRRPEATEAAQEILFGRCLRDPRPDQRLAAARALFQGERRPTLNLLLRVAEGLAGSDIDARLQAIRGLKACAIDDDVLARAVADLEAQRPVPCPECRATVRPADLPGHLHGRHGYVAIQGRLLPYETALRSLWEQVFSSPDVEVGARLISLYLEHHESTAAASYLQAFQAEIQARSTRLPPLPGRGEPAPFWWGLARCLAAHELTQLLCRSLLTHTDERLRLLARLALIPVVASRFVGAAVDSATFRQSVEALCPREGLDAQIAVCRWLSRAGASARAAADLEAELELERVVACPYCSAQIRRRDEKEHLRQAHAVYEFHGVQRAWEETLRYLRGRMFGSPPDASAAQHFLSVARDRHGEQAALARLGAAALEETKARPGPSVVAVVAALPVAAAIAEQLLQRGEPEATRLGLSLFAALEGRAPSSLVDWVLVRVGDNTVPFADRQQAVESFFRGSNEELSLRALKQLTKHSADPFHALEVLAVMVNRVGERAGLTAYRQELEDRLRLSCPRCQVVLSVAQMRRHLWQEHQLVLDGKYCRSPWSVVGRFIDLYQVQPDPDHLKKGLAWAVEADPHDGPSRFAQLALGRGVPRHLLRLLLPNLDLEEASPITSGAPAREAKPIPSALKIFALVCVVLFLLLLLLLRLR